MARWRADDQWIVGMRVGRLLDEEVRQRLAGRVETLPVDCKSVEHGPGSGPEPMSDLRAALFALDQQLDSAFGELGDFVSLRLRPPLPCGSARQTV